jgi:nitroreductase
MELREAIYARRSVRSFKSDAVNETTIRSLIDAAIQAPSALNEQPWSFCVVLSQSKHLHISNAAKPHLLGSH